MAVQSFVKGDDLKKLVEDNRLRLRLFSIFKVRIGLK